jgi:hypothetical protein
MEHIGARGRWIIERHPDRSPGVLVSFWTVDDKEPQTFTAEDVVAGLSGILSRPGRMRWTGEDADEITAPGFADPDSTVVAKGLGTLRPK